MSDDHWQPPVNRPGGTSLDDDTLRLVHGWREAGMEWADVDARLDREGSVKSAYLRARRGGALAAALGIAAAPVTTVEPSRTTAQAVEVAPIAAHAAASPRMIVSAGDDGPEIRGVVAGEAPDPDEVWRKAEAVWHKQETEAARKADQVIRFNHGPACLVFMADLHLGGQGVDYPRIRREAELARDIPNAGVWLAGDVIDNFIWGWAASIRQHTEITIPEERVLAKTVLDILGPRLIASVGGNHCGWSRKAAGIDVLRDLTARVRPDALYDTDDCTARVEVGPASVTVRVRHKWRGNSIYNATHGQERAARWDDDADIYVGAHTHTEGTARSFSVGGAKKLAVQLGAYKRIDDYARTNGFPKPDGSTAVAVIINERGQWFAVEHLELAAEIMYRLVQ